MTLRELAVGCGLLGLAGTLSGQIPILSGVEGSTHAGRVIKTVDRTSSVPGVSEWHVDPRPEVSIGMIEGPKEHLLVNVIDATELDDGTIVLALFHREFFRLRYFDQAGAFITSVGRWGEGPFEFTRGFRSLSTLPGDSLIIVSDDHRYSVFGPVAQKVRSGRFRFPVGSIPLGVVASDFVVLASVGTPDDLTPGTSRYRWTFSVFDTDTETVTAIGALSSESVVGREGEILRLPFNSRPHWSLGGSRVWLGDSSRGRIDGYRPSDGSQVSIHLERPATPVTDADEDRWKEFDLRRAGSEDLRRVYERHHRGLDFPETFPRFQDLQIDESGNLWVLQYEPPWSEETYVWDVFHPEEGTHLAMVTIPFAVLGSRLRTSMSPMSPLLEIGRDYVLVKHAGPLGVVRVRKHRLTKVHPAR